MADNHGLIEIEVREQTAEIVGHAGNGDGSLAAKTVAAVPPCIPADDSVIRDELASDRVPNRMAGCPFVQEDDRGAVALVESRKFFAVVGDYRLHRHTIRNLRNVGIMESGRASCNGFDSGQVS